MSGTPLHPDDPRILMVQSAALSETQPQARPAVGHFAPIETADPISNAVLDIAAQRRRAQDRVDAQAEQTRLLWITSGTGQALVYQLKREEAQRYLALGNTVPADPSNWPLLASELGITGASLAEIAQAIAQTAQAWTLIAAAIERVRLQAKRDIGEAPDDVEIQRVLASLVWPRPN